MYSRSHFACLLVCLLVLPLSLGACTKQVARATTSPPLDLPGLLPTGEAVSGWAVVAGAAVYDRENLYHLVNGQAESFFAYGFERVVVQRYQDSASVWLNVEIWQLATPDDAFGLFTAGKVGQAAEIGVAGDADPGRRLAFWQDRYFVSLGANQPVDDAVLYAFANLIAAALPQGGQTPQLVAALPVDGLLSGSQRFFHEEISIQNDLWLGGENLLGLSQETDGALARYDLDGEAAILLWLEYPAPVQAAEASKALQAAGIDDFLAGDVNGKRLAAVFGKADPAAAQALLDQVLK
ncbi:MAG: DUF6599 family protein [Chloroflexota bacterium]